MQEAKELISFTLNKQYLDSFLSAIRERDFSPPKIITQAKLLSPFLALQYEKDAGVWEGFTLEKHTMAVLSQYKKYMQSQIEEKDQEFFPLFLTFHDIGKPIAVEKGNKALQHPFSTSILQCLLPQLKANSYLKLAEGLLAGDFLGGYVRGWYSLQEVFQKIQESAAMAELPTQEFYFLLKAYYLVDASAYTQEAIPDFYKTETAGLGWLFSFKDGKINFSDEKIQQKMKVLEDKLKYLA